MLRLQLFTVCIREFADEMALVISSGPGLGDLCANGTGGAPELIGQRVHFVAGKAFGHLEDTTLQLARLLIHDQILKTPRIRMTHQLHKELNTLLTSFVSCMVNHPPGPVNCKLRPALSAGNCALGTEH